MKLIYLSPVHRASYEQRPHFMVRSLLEDGCVDRVLWINPVPLRLPEVADFKKRRGVYNQRTPSCSSVKVIDVPSLPVEPVDFVNRINNMFWKGVMDEAERFTDGGEFVLGMGKPGRLSLMMLERFRKKAWSFYDAMDDFPEFYTGAAHRKVAEWEREIVAEVNLLVTSSTGLAEKFSLYKEKTVVIKNACKRPEWPYACSMKDGREPVLGYIGTIGKWFDWDILKETAIANSDCRILLVGPVFVEPEFRLPANVTIAPPCTHEESAGYMQKFSVGLIPFRICPLTDGVDPVKFYEYRVMGLPVVTTWFGEMTRRNEQDYVFFIRNGECRQGVRAAINAARKMTVEDTVSFGRENNWQRRFSALAGIIRRRFSAS